MSALSNQNSIQQNPGQILGGPNSEIHYPGQILGGDNSVFNSAGEIFTSLRDRSSDDIIRTSRTFVGPHGVPPKNFAAYGIVAFPQKSTRDSYKRYESICEAYVATLPASNTLSAAPSAQIVTVWPVDDDSLLGQLSGSGRAPCKLAIDRYDLRTSLSALKEAQTQENISLSGNGPYLLAWSPATQKGQNDAIVLILDLSSAFTPAHFEYAFREWRKRIEQNPDIWRRGWVIADLRTEIRYWADKWGTALLSFGHAKE